MTTHRYPYTGNPSDFLRYRMFDGRSLTVASHSSRERRLRAAVPYGADYALLDPAGEPGERVWAGCAVSDAEGKYLESIMPLPDKAARPVARGSTRSISVTQAEWETHVHPAIQAIADVRQKKITSYGVVFLPAKPE